MRLVEWPIVLVRQGIASFHPRTLPPMLRANYGRELWAWMFLPLMLGAVEGGAMGNVVKKYFTNAHGVDETALNYAVAAVVAAPSLANITSFIWASLAHGRNRIRFIVGLQLVTVIMVALVGLAEQTWWGLALVVALVIASRACWTGVITLRTSIWAANYPRADRARIAGKLATIQSIVMAAVCILIGWAMDYDEQCLHWLFPLSAAGGMVGVAIYRTVRLRGQKRLARAERAGTAAGEASRLTINPVSVWRLLKADPSYREFMTWMFIFGLGNLMLTAPLAVVLHEQFDVSYALGILITTVLPSLFMPPSIPLWTRLMARRHVVGFRAVHAWSYVTASLMMFLGVMFNIVELLLVASVVTGIANGGGVLAWNLGHHDFAPPGKDSAYMGVHVTLTGIRGLIAPFIAIGLYEGLDRLFRAASEPALHNAGAGAWVFFICFLINGIGAVGFNLMNRRMNPSSHSHRV